MVCPRASTLGPWQFNPLRPGGGQKSKNSNSSSESTISSIGTPVHPMHPYPPYSAMQPFYYNPYTPPSAPFQQHLPHAPAPVPRPSQFSDSYPEEVDPLEKMIAYITWLTEKSPMQSPTLLRAKETLMEEGHTFKTIEKLSEADFEKMGIKSGTAMQLKSYIDSYKRKTMNYAWSMNMEMFWSYYSSYYSYTFNATLGYNRNGNDFQLSTPCMSSRPPRMPPWTQMPLAKHSSSSSRPSTLQRPPQWDCNQANTVASIPNILPPLHKSLQAPRIVSGYRRTSLE